jgi:hypothetical protein
MLHVVVERIALAEAFKCHPCDAVEPLGLILCRVDGFDEDEAQSKSNERAIVLVGFLAA